MSQINGCGCVPCQQPVPSCTPPPVTVNFGTTPGAVQRLDITAWTGGLPNCLDSVLIGPFAVSTIMNIQIGGAPNEINTVQKVQSTAAPVAELIIRPPDYNALTNPYQWYVVA